MRLYFQNINTLPRSNQQQLYQLLQNLKTEKVDLIQLVETNVRVNRHQMINEIKLLGKRLWATTQVVETKGPTDRWNYHCGGQLFITTDSTCRRIKIRQPTNMNDGRSQPYTEHATLTS